MFSSVKVIKVCVFLYSRKNLHKQPKWMHLNINKAKLDISVLAWMPLHVTNAHFITFIEKKFIVKSRKSLFPHINFTKTRTDKKFHAKKKKIWSKSKAFDKMFPDQH